MGAGLTSLGHPWTGRRRPHNHYVIGDPADTTPTAHSVGTAGRKSPLTGDCLPPGEATSEGEWYSESPPRKSLSPATVKKINEEIEAVSSPAYEHWDPTGKTPDEIAAWCADYGHNQISKKAKPRRRGIDGTLFYC